MLKWIRTDRARSPAALARTLSPPGENRRRFRNWLNVGLVFGLNLFGWVFGTPLSLRADDSAQFSLSVHIINPPNAITDLSAAAVGSQDGDVQLLWTAP